MNTAKKIALEQRLIKIYGPDYNETDIPTIIRKQEKEPDHDELNHEAKIRSLEAEKSEFDKREAEDIIEGADCLEEAEERLGEL